MKLLIGTKNPDKIKELGQLLANLPIHIVTIAEMPDLPDADEPYATIEENAVTKAQVYAKFSGLPTIADDTGFFIEALNGEPGVFAARYAGENCSYQLNRQKVLHKMQFQSNRKAYFYSVVAYCEPNGEIHTFHGKVEGEIAFAELGDNGFGYDSIFYLPKCKKTFAQMSDSEKNEISHRSLALKEFITFFSKKF
jgi:XTP/dITP diphosphohydrolase